MPGMNPGHELVSPAAADPPSPPPPPSGPTTPDAAPAGASAEPVTPALILKWIAARGSEPWFPSAHARESGIPRDALDEPLNDLRLAGLVKVAAWVRKAGQGFVLTPEGEQAAADPSLLAKMRPADEPPPAIPLEVPVESGPRPGDMIEFRPPIVTPALIGANVLWFAVGLVVAGVTGAPTDDYLAGKHSGLLHRLGGVTGFDLLAGGWWRLLTCCFVHVGGLHLLVNMMSLGMMGPLAELLWGRWRVLLIYLVAGLAGSCLAMALRPVDLDSGAVTILAGASGAICGVLGSLLAWMLTFRTFLPPAIAADLFRRLGMVVLLTVAISVVPWVSWEGHLGGGVAGFVAAGLLNALRFGDRRRQVTAAVLLALLPALCVGGLIVAMRGADSWRPLRDAAHAREAAAAAAHYDETVAPLLSMLAPDAVKPVEREARVVVVRSLRKPPATAARVRGRVEQKRAVAADAVARLSEPPTGVTALDRKRAKAKAFAEARLRSLELLLALLASPTDDATLEAWLPSVMEANRLWVELVVK